jgi:pumilio family protein 6
VEPAPCLYTDTVIATNSKEAHAKQKALAQERKAAKPNADSIGRSKKIWERLRRQSHVPLEERKALVKELFEIISGRVKEFVIKHDAGRVIQTALKYGNLEQRKMIARELKGEYRTLAESRYAKFTIGKILVKGDEEIRDLVVPEFYGNVRRLIKHSEASWILDDVYRGAASKRQKAQLLREWYGAEYAIFQGGKEGDIDGSLKSVLDAHPEKRAPIMRYLFQMIDQLVQKKTTGFTMLHDAMLQYYLNVVPGSEESNNFLEMLKGDEEGDLMKNLAFTESGAQVVALAFASSGAKDRKLLLRIYKGVIETMALDQYGRQVLLTALEVTDDTVLTSKSIYGELIPKDVTPEIQDRLLGYVLNLNSRALLLYPFGSNPRSLLAKEDLALLTQVYDIRTQTSKKDSDIRHKELARYLSSPFISLIAERAGELIQSSFGCQFIQDVLIGADGDKTPALDAILAALAREDLQEVVVSPPVGRMLKALVHSGHFNPATKAIEVCEPALGFADMLWKQISNDIISWATGPNAFVVVGLLESKDFSQKSALKDSLKKSHTKLQKTADKAKAADQAAEKGKKKGDTAEVGTKGARLLLGMLEI